MSRPPGRHAAHLAGLLAFIATLTALASAVANR